MRNAVACLALLLALAGCATPGAPEPPVGLDLSGTDESQAAVVLGSYLLARGYRVERVGDAALDVGAPDGSAFTVEILLDAAGLDRLVLGRRYAAREGVSRAVVADFAQELNGTLNVGAFSAYPPGIVFLSPLSFLDTLDPLLLDAFIAFTAEVELAVRRVEAGRQILVELESPGGSG